MTNIIINALFSYSGTFIKFSQEFSYKEKVNKKVNRKGRREKVAQTNVCIANKQMHDKHKDQLPLPQSRWSKC